MLYFFNIQVLTKDEYYIDIKVAILISQKPLNKAATGTTLTLSMVAYSSPV